MNLNTVMCHCDLLISDYSGAIIIKSCKTNIIYARF